MEKDEIYAIIKQKYPDFTMKHYENTILTKENLEKYGVDILFTLASTLDWEVLNILDGVQETSKELSFEEIEKRIAQEDTSIFSQEMRDFIQNKDGILEDYNYFSQNREWGLLGYYRPSEHIKVLQHVKVNGMMENYKKIEKMLLEAECFTFEPTSCLLLSDTAMSLFDAETIFRLSKKIQSVIQENDEKISIEEFEALFKDSPEKLAVLFSSNFQERIFGNSYRWTSGKTREKVTREEIDKLYEEYLEITAKFPQEALKMMHEESDEQVYDQLVEANRAGLLKDSSMLENWNNWKDKMPNSIPFRWYFLRNEFVEKYSAQELLKFSEDDLLIKRLDEHGILLLKLLEIEDIQEPEKILTLQGPEDPMDRIFGYTEEPAHQVEYSMAKFAEDLLNNDAIRELVSSFKSSKKGPVLGRIVTSLYNRYKSVAQRNDNEQSTVSLSEIEVVFQKAKKFQEVARFIPPLGVMLKYPEDQIEKFDKKKWAELVKHNIYSQDNDAKYALIEAIHVMGVFETDEDAKRRYSLLQKFATYVPTQISASSRVIDEAIKYNYGFNIEGVLSEHFKLISEQEIPESLRYELHLYSLYNDPIFLKMFGGDREVARKQLLEWNLPESMSPNQMKEVLKEVEDNEQEIATEEIAVGERAIIQYIYRKGYKKAYDLQCQYQLTRNLQTLDAKTREDLTDEIRYLYGELGVSNIMTKNKMHAIFDGMDMHYKPGFYNFFVKNLETILQRQDIQKMLAKIQNQWEKIQEEFIGQEITFDMCTAYLSNITYSNVQPQDIEIAKLSVNCNYDQSMFDQAVRLHQEQLKRTQSSIPAIGEDVSLENYTYQVLRLDDPAAIFVGELTNCCQVMNNAGESCMLHSIMSQNGRVLVVRDTNGKVVSQSWIWRNKNVLCLDNVETVQRDHHHKRLVSNEILNTIQRAAQEFIEVDKEQFENWSKTKLSELMKQKENGEISDQEFEVQKARIEQTVSSQRLTKVTVGSGYSDISLKGLKLDDENRAPEEDVEYIADSRTQFILYQDPEAQNTAKVSSNEKTVALYTDPEELKRLINIDLSNLELPEGRDGLEEQWEEEDWENDWEEEQGGWGEAEQEDWEEDGGFIEEDAELWDNNFMIAKEEIERFARNFVNSKKRQEAQEFIAEITRYLQRTTDVQR